MSKVEKIKSIELLAPARDAATALAAINHGADAVYIGPSSHGARSEAGNSIDDIKAVVEAAHPFGVKVYATVNTLVYNDEVEEVERLIWRLYRAGVDALIVQDMGVLRMNLPPIALHASTQCDVRTPEKARFLADVGFSQVVIARELSINETARIAEACPVPVEAFVHGALCVSYSGDCQAGWATAGRSANRGECPQICRHRFNLEDGQGNVLVADKHLLSLRDLNRSEQLEKLMEAGVRSFKIEGRLKSASYVKNVTAAYRRLIDDIIALNPEKYCRVSAGESTPNFKPELGRSFNRGFTTYFTNGRPGPTQRMASTESPKWIGLPVGTVKHCSPDGRKLNVDAIEALNNGDGLGYFDTKGEYCGFRLNRVEGNTIFPAKPLDIKPGTKLYRNADRVREQQVEASEGKRTLGVELTLRATRRGMALDAVDELGRRVSVAEDCELAEARTPQRKVHEEVLSKSGDTIFSVKKIIDEAEALFVPKSMLATLRRRALDALLAAGRITYHYDRRRSEAIVDYGVKELDYHSNVANRLAREFYADHGVKRLGPALEVAQAMSNKEPLTVMTTRYCIRREMGRCLKTPQGREWPQDLYLTSGNVKLRLVFDCDRCGMRVQKT